MCLGIGLIETCYVGSVHWGMGNFTKKRNKEIENIEVL